MVLGSLLQNPALDMRRQGDQMTKCTAQCIGGEPRVPGFLRLGSRGFRV